MTISVVCGVGWVPSLDGRWLVDTQRGSYWSESHSKYKGKKRTAYRRCASQGSLLSSHGRPENTSRRDASRDADTARPYPRRQPFTFVLPAVAPTADCRGSHIEPQEHELLGGGGTIR